MVCKATTTGLQNVVVFQNVAAAQALCGSPRAAVTLGVPLGRAAMNRVRPGIASVLAYRHDH
jgi:hypothetical protein